MKARFIGLILISWFLSNCGVYHPQSVDIPLIDHKKDLRIDAGLSVIPSVYTTVSYGLTRNIAIQGFGSAGTGSRYYFQLSPGFYKKTGGQKIIELYSGFGYGYGYTSKDLFASDIWAPHYEENLFGNYQVYFVQFNWGKKSTEYKAVDWGLGIKAGLFHSNMTDRNYYEIYSESGPFPIHRENGIFIEPSVVIRTGKKSTKFCYKIGLTRVFKLSDQSNSIPAPFLNIGFGVNFSPVRTKNQN